MKKLATALRVPAFAKKLHWKEVLAILFILVGVYFFKQEHAELRNLVPALKEANQIWLLWGLILTVIYLFLQGFMYFYCFRSVGARINIWSATELFLKRNFISVFLPAGGISSLSYQPKSLRRSVAEQKHIVQASALYAFIGILTVFLIGVPVMFIIGARGNILQTSIKGLAIVLALLVGVYFVFRSLRNKGKMFHLVLKIFPSWRAKMEEIFTFDIRQGAFIKAVLVSLLIEVSGIVHLYIAMGATGSAISWSAACAGYVVAVILLVISPFMRGLGAVELSLTYILSLFGYDTLHALEIAILFRIFEFWLPLVAGIGAFAVKGRNILMRLTPAVLIFILGIVNIFSVLVRNPSPGKLHFLRDYLPVESIHGSWFLVVFLGILLLVTAAFLVRGLRSAWIIALVLSLLSALGHFYYRSEITDGFFALGVAALLIFTMKQYRLKSNPKLVNLGIVTAAGVFLGVIIYGFVGFYFLDVRHFGLDFTWKQSIIYTIKTFFLVIDNGLNPLTRFGGEFILSIRVLGVGAWGFFFYTVIRPYIGVSPLDLTAHDKAKALLQKYGNSPVDYFKMDDDKIFYFAASCEGFVAYRVANGFAIVLEEPVCHEANKLIVVREFEQQCRRMGLKPAFYRVDEDSMYYFNQLKKKKIVIGQEAIMDVNGFTLEGKEKKSLRNGLNSLQKKGFVIQTHRSPIAEAILDELKSVSDHWLDYYRKKEMVFSQGKFDRDKIKANDIILVRDSEEKIVAFLNIIPDYAPGECTYDLIRKTEDAPGGCMDALIVELIKYARENKLHSLNLGMVPFSGIHKPVNTPEQLVKFAYEKVRRFRQFKGLREFKEKYATQWLNKYLVYENDFDLMQLPAALNKVMQPKM